VTFPAAAQIQQAWVARYNNGITNGTNQAVKMALDSNGNIYVTGFSQNTNGNLGYVTIKYAPNGAQLWVARFDSTNYPTATPAAMAIDVSNNAVITGSALTIKYDSNGNQLWTAPNAGSTVAVDTNASVYIGGFQNFETVKLNSQGSNVWTRTYSDEGPTASQTVLVDNQNNVYVSGLDTYYYVPPGAYGDHYETLMTIKYDSNGDELWKSIGPEGPVVSVQVTASGLDSADNLYLAASFNSYFYIFKCTNSDGGLAGINLPDPNSTVPSISGLALDSTGDLLLTGQWGYVGPDYEWATGIYGTFKGTSSGAWIWTNLYPSVAGDYPESAALALALDSANNSYVTGYSAAVTGTNNIVTIKYGPNGNQLWLQSYNGLNAGNDAGNAIVVDKNGNVYVTGYETLPGGGTGIVTIKYIPVSLQHRADGTVLLEVQGSPGESFDIQASGDLLNWTDLGTMLADTNGLMQFDDTNAPSFPARFYYTNPQ